MNATTMTVTEALAACDREEDGALTDLYHTVRAALAPLPEGEAGAMAAEAEAAARTMAPPVPGVTRNGGFTVRAVIHMHPHQAGLLEAWVVAAEDPERGAWVTWNAYRRDGEQAGTLSYDAGHYFDAVSGPSGLGRADNRRAAMADLAVRAGMTAGVAVRIAREVTRYHSDLSPVPAEDRRMAARLLKWAQR